MSNKFEYNVRSGDASPVTINVKQTVPRSVFYWTMGIAGLGWMVATHLTGKLTQSAWVSELAAIGTEVAKAAFIGSSVGILLKRILKEEHTADSKTTLLAHGIEAIYASRSDAASTFMHHVRDPRVKRILLIGTSLRDFLGGAGILLEIWATIRERLRQEEDRKLPQGERLKVRLMLLDPQSGPGLFRYKVEKDTIAPGGLALEVPNGLAQVRSVIQDIYQKDESDYLEARLYEHGGFAFAFISDKAAVVEQYDYRDHTKTGPLPLLQYGVDTEAYAQLLHSYETTWRQARTGILKPHHIGVASGIEDSKMNNIFRHDVRLLSARRQMECIQVTQPDETVCIKAITGRFYMNGAPLDLLRRISSPVQNGSGAKVKLLILNPVSQQAILRAIADNTDLKDIGKGLLEWNWNTHEKSDLYTDAHRTMSILRRLKRDHSNIELRLTSAAISCSLLLTPQAIFVEQYLYGRSKEFETGLVLGGEHPIFEYKISSRGAEPTVEEQIFKSAFSVMWDSLSLPFDKYDITKESEKEEFGKNLDIVRLELTGKAEDAAQLSHVVMLG